MKSIYTACAMDFGGEYTRNDGMRRLRHAIRIHPLLLGLIYTMPPEPTQQQPKMRIPAHAGIRVNAEHRKAQPCRRFAAEKNFEIACAK
jgi:hypothetical protein